MLIGFVGPLGSGKTCAMTWAGLRAWKSGSKIYSNYRLYGIPFHPVKTMEQVAAMKDGTFLGDELWLWCDSRTSTSIKNRLITRILLASRHVGINLFFTSQSESQIDKRVRLIQDMTAMPQRLSEDCVRLKFYQGRMRSGMNEYFNPVCTYPFYDTTEVVEEVQTGISEDFTCFYSFEENKAWMSFLNQRGIWGRNAIRICDTIQKEIAPELLAEAVRRRQQTPRESATHENPEGFSLRSRTSDTPSPTPRPR